VHPFTKEKRIAGVDSFKKLLLQNPTLSLRTPEATSINRARVQQSSGTEIL